jgi:VanZ family protein
MMIKKNILSILVAVLIAYLSLSESDNFNKVSFLNFPGADKIVHFLMYFAFMSVIVFENRKNIGKIPALLLISLIPFFYGALMEVLQTLLTSTRIGSALDLLSDLAGVLFTVVICLIIRPVRKQIIK